MLLSSGTCLWSEDIILVWLQKALELLLQTRRFQVKFFPLKFLRSELRQQCESGFVLAMWHRLRGCRALRACLQRPWLLPGHEGREQEQALAGAAALQLTVFVLLGQGG